jgi:hypothetical protein
MSNIASLYAKLKAGTISRVEFKILKRMSHRKFKKSFSIFKTNWDKVNKEDM